MPYSTADLRKFLVEAFSDEELKSLCFDYFRDVYDDFTAGMTKGQMIQLLIERCVRREAVPNLQAALRAELPDQYEKRFGLPIPAAVPVEIAHAGRDPRQVFISHANADADFAHRLAADLKNAGWRIWIAPDSIPPGEKWVEAIGRGLDGSAVFVVVLTPAAVGSRWVKTETNAAIVLENRGDVQFIPLEVATCAVPILWNAYQRIPFRSRYEDGLRALLGRLGAADGETRRQGERERGRAGDGETKPLATPQVEQHISVAPPGLHLTGPQVQGLLAALLDAYDETGLRQMVRFQLDERLDAIAGGADLSQVAFNLIAWAERTGSIAELIAAAHAFNPGNARLAAFARSLGGIAVVEPGRAAPAPAPPRTEPAAAQIAFDWVTVPAGEFLMGSDKKKDKLAYDNETPQHTLHLPEYRIVRVPVTVVQFAQFVQATGSQIPATLDVQKKANHPVTNVSWHDALVFCRWAGVRLPTEAEWEKAARGTDGRIWPWGNAQPNNGLCNFDQTVGDTTPVGRYPDGKSQYGLLDVAGNVWEWTSNLWGKDVSTPEFGYPYDPKDGRENLSAPDTVLRVLRGGSFGDVLQDVRCAFRYWDYPDSPGGDVGFRVVSPGL